MSAIVCDRPDGSQVRLAFGLREGADDTPSLARQLDLLGAVLDGEPAVVVWDNLNVHNSHDVQAFVAAQAWLEVAYLPPYAPGLKGGRGCVGQPEGPGAGQPCLPDNPGAGCDRSGRLVPDPPRPAAAIWLPAPQRTPPLKSPTQLRDDR